MILRLLTLISFAFFADPILASDHGQDPIQDPIAYKSVAACSEALQTPPGSTSRELPDPLHLRSWNVMKFDLPGAQEELQRMSRDVDLVFLQETVRSTDHPPELQPHRYFSPGYARGSEATGVEIRSKTAADLSCEFTFTEPWLRTPKAVSAVRLPFREGALLLINLHAINFTLSSTDYRKQLAALSRLVKAHRGPVVVAGDFNHWNVWRAKALQAWALDLELLEVGFEPDWRSRHLGSRVDAIFLRGLTAISSAALPTTRSDHHAIAASLKLLKGSADPAADNRAEVALPTPAH